MKLPNDHTLRFEVHPRAFFQPNTLQAEVLYGEVIRADAVVVAMGPWTSRVLSAAAEVPGAPAVPAVPAVYGQKYHAVLMRPASGRVRLSTPGKS